MMSQNHINTPELLTQHGYTYISLLGEGSNGKTYLARNQKTGENVAIKALKFSENLKNYELFKREAETLQTINHPGVPRFYEFITGQTEFTECWIVQEYIEGKSILDMLEEKQEGNKFFSIKETLELLYETIGIIQMLQTQYVPPIIHRDIKPSNILIRKQRKSGRRVCLIDFGAVANPQKRSNQSTVAGTVGYMAPEQLLGNCTIQSDYYALGATALHMLTGIAPSDFPSDGFKLQFEAILREKVPQIPDQFVEFLNSLMASNTADRPHNIDELIQALNSLIDALNSHVEEHYQETKNAVERYEKRYHILGEINTIPYIVLSIFVTIILYGILLSILIDINITFKKPFWEWILPIPILIFLFSIKPTMKKLNFLHHKLNMLEFIDVNKISSHKEIEENKTISTQQGAFDEIAVTGKIAHITATEIEYYYIADGKARRGIKQLTDKIRQYEESHQISLKVGDSINIKYIKENNRYISSLDLS